jgi:hypothetical protein
MEALLDWCGLLVIQLFIQMHTKCSDINLLLGILGAVSSLRVTGCKHGLIIHVNVKRLWRKWCIVVWIGGTVICSGINYFLSILGCISVHGRILDVGVDNRSGISKGGMGTESK